MTGRHRWIALLAAVALLASAVGVAGCGGGGDDGEGPATFGKTRIAINLGLAAGATKKWIVDPAQRGDFREGAPKRKRTIAKAVLAGAFSAKQLNDARKLAQRDPDLQPLLGRIAGFSTVLAGLTAALQGGNVDIPALVGVGDEVDQLLDAGRALGLDINETAPPSL